MSLILFSSVQYSGKSNDNVTLIFFLISYRWNYFNYKLKFHLSVNLKYTRMNFYVVLVSMEVNKVLQRTFAKHVTFLNPYVKIVHNSILVKNWAETINFVTTLKPFQIHKINQNLSKCFVWIFFWGVYVHSLARFGRFEANIGLHFTTVCKSGHVCVGETYTSYALSLKPRRYFRHVRYIKELNIMKSVKPSKTVNNKPNNVKIYVKNHICKGMFLFFQNARTQKSEMK